MKRSVASIVLGAALAACSSPGGNAPLIPGAPAPASAPAMAPQLSHGAAMGMAPRAASPTFALVIQNVPRSLRSVYITVGSSSNPSELFTTVNIDAATSSACKDVSGKRWCTVAGSTYPGFDTVEMRGYTKGNGLGTLLFDTQTWGIGKSTGSTTIDVPNALYVKDFSINGSSTGSMTHGPLGDDHVYDLSQTSSAQFITSATESGTVSYHPQPAPTAGAFNSYQSIEAGSNSTLWMTDGGFETSEGIVSMTTTGQQHFYPATTGSGCYSQNVPISIANGPNGNAWFLEFTCLNAGGGGVGEITPSGTITDHYLPEFQNSQIFTFGTGQHQIVSGKDGAVYFYATTCLPSASSCDGSYNTVTRMSTGGAITIHRLDPVKTGSSCTCGFVTRGGDGNVWALIPSTPPGVWQKNTLARITPSGAVSYFYAGFNLANDLGTGPDGNLYFTDQGGVERFQIMSAPFGQLENYIHSNCSWSHSVSSGPGGYLYVAGAEMPYCSNSWIEKIEVP